MAIVKQGFGSATGLLIIILFSALGSSYSQNGENGHSAFLIIWNTGTDYSGNRWNRSNSTVSKGDTLTLVFSNPHSALVVTEVNYKTCNTNNYLQALQSGTEFTIEGDTYIICGTPGHCKPDGGAGGMSMAIRLPDTGASSGGSNSGIAPGAPPPSPGSRLEISALSLSTVLILLIASLYLNL